jgi:hypothetical protein
MTDWNKQTVSGLIYRNAAGGFYQPGRMYHFPRKTEVAKVYLRLCEEQARPSVSETTRISQVGWAYANLVVTKLKAIGIIVDPELQRRRKLDVLRPGQKLNTVHEMFILSLRTLGPAQPLYSYVQELDTHFGKAVSYHCIANWFHERWNFQGNLKRTNLVWLGKCSAGLYPFRMEDSCSMLRPCLPSVRLLNYQSHGPKSGQYPGYHLHFK